MAGTELVPADVEPRLRELASSARSYADAGMAANTRRAYASDWADFTAWCDQVPTRALPADPASVALYLTALAGKLTTTTLGRRLAAIRAAHRAMDLPAPDSADLRRVWSGIQRSHGRPPRKKRALVTEDLRKLVRKLPDTLAGKRDKAILLLGFAGALRRSELAAICLMSQEWVKNDPNLGQIRLVFVSAGLELHIDRSKADQLGQGAIVGVPNGKTMLCPVTAVRDWLDAAKISSGPVFRAVDRHGRMGASALAPAAIAQVVKRACEAVGLDPALFAGHSLRAGLATQAAANDVAADVIMRQTRHARYDTLVGYIRDGERFKRNAAGKVGL